MSLQRCDANKPENKSLIYDVDGDQYTCHRVDFINLQESPCGFGNNHQEALENLLRQEV